jgi:SPP1 family phage portal protein
MDAEQIKEIVSKRKPLSTRCYDQKSYKIGLNAGIFQALPGPAPDNRIPIPFIRRAVKLVKGYFAKVGNITYEDKAGWFEKTMAPIYDENDEELETAAIFEDSITYGSGFELNWWTKEDKFQFAPIPVDQAIPIYSDDLKPKMVAFVWYRCTQGEDELATWYDDKEYQEYVKTKDKDWTLIPGRSGPHLYGRVPILEANTDRDKRNLFDPVLPLIDAYDKLSSEVANEHEKFAQSILLLRNTLDTIHADENGLTDADKVALFRVLDKLGDNVKDSASYLERNVNDTFIDNTFNRWERLIYEMLCIFNPNDESFATASGVAQAYKLLGFELMVADIESYFSTFLQARIKLIAGHSLSGAKEGDADQVVIKFRRNLPFDLAGMADIAAKLKGLVSDETLLKLFPATVIDDVDAELQRIKDEAPEEVIPPANQTKVMPIAS